MQSYANERQTDTRTQNNEHAMHVQCLASKKGFMADSQHEAHYSNGHTVPSFGILRPQVERNSVAAARVVIDASSNAAGARQFTGSIRPRRFIHFELVAEFPPACSICIVKQCKSTGEITFKNGTSSAHEKA